MRHSASITVTLIAVILWRRGMDFRWWIHDYIHSDIQIWHADTTWKMLATKIVLQNIYDIYVPVISGNLWQTNENIMVVHYMKCSSLMYFRSMKSVIVYDGILNKFRITSADIWDICAVANREWYNLPFNDSDCGSVLTKFPYASSGMLPYNCNCARADDFSSNKYILLDFYLAGDIIQSDI